MSAPDGKSGSKLSRRRFVALTGAAAPPMSAHQKEYERQKAGTLSTLKTIRAYPLPPGGDLPVVFRPMRTPKKGR